MTSPVIYAAAYLLLVGAPPTETPVPSPIYDPIMCQLPSPPPPHPGGGCGRGCNHGVTIQHAHPQWLTGGWTGGGNTCGGGITGCWHGHGLRTLRPRHHRGRHHHR